MFAVLLAFSILCTLSVGNIQAAENTASADPITIGSTQNLTVEAGSIVTVPVKVTNNSGLMGIGLNVTYDPSILTPISVEATELTQNGTYNDSIETAKENTFKIIWADMDAVQSDGTFFNIKFQVSEYAEGDTGIQIQAGKADTFDGNMDEVSVTCDPITVKVVEPTSQGALLKGQADRQVNDGEEISIPILIDNPSAVSSVDFTISYDTTAFTYVSCENGLGRNCKVTQTDNGCQVSVTDIDTTQKSGKLLALKLKTAKYQGGNYIFSLASSAMATRDFRVKVTNTHADEPAIISDGEIVRDGAVLKVPVKISNNHGLAGFRITAVYDNNVLTPTGIEKSSKLSGTLIHSVADAQGQFDVLWSNSDNYYGNDVLYTMVFKIQADTDAKETTIRMSYTQDDTCDELGTDVPLTMQDISIALQNEDPNPTPDPKPDPTPDPDPEEAVLQRITAIKTKTSYMESDTLEVNDLTVTAEYTDGTTKKVTGYTTNASKLDMTEAGQKNLEISYTEGDKTVSTVIMITVKKKSFNEITLKKERVMLCQLKKSQTYTISASAKYLGLEYESLNEKIKVDAKGKVTIPANYKGTFEILVSTKDDERYWIDVKTVTFTVAAHSYTIKTTLPTVFKKGVTTRTCKRCGYKETVYCAKQPAVLKLSCSKKTIKNKKNFTLKVTKLGRGDSIKSYTYNKKIVTVKKVKTNQYKITGKKKGTAKITFVTKAGKKASCTVKVK